MTDKPDSIGVVMIEHQKVFAQALARSLAEEPDIDVLGMVYNGQDAAAYVAMIQPRVVLLGYHIPDRNGLDVTADIMAANPEVSVVMLTDPINEGILIAAIEAGCSGFLTKDVSVAEVAEAIRTAAAGRTNLSAPRLTRLLSRLNRHHHTPGSDLTTRELEILHMLAAGWGTPRIAEHLVLSVNTIRNYVQSILTKLGTHSKLEAVALAVSQNIVDSRRYQDSPAGTGES